MAIGATMGLAVARWPDGLASTVPMDGQLLDTPPLREPCKADMAQDMAAFFLNSACGSNKPHARHGARATNRVATVILGRAPAATAAMEAAPVRVAAGVIEPTRVSVGQIDVGNAEKLATTAVERTAPPKKSKAQASAPIALARPGGEWGRPNATLNAYAATPRFGRESYDPYGDTLRATTPQSGFAAPFGRSW
jgi:hypothetical protein